MLKTAEEVQEANKVINGIDSPNLLSVDSTSPLPYNVDKVGEDTEKEKAESTEKKVDELTKPEGAEVKKEEKTDTTLTKPSEKKADEKENTEDKKPLQEPKVTDAVQKRIDSMTKKYRTAERERDFEKKKRLEAEEELEKLKSKIPVTDKPKREDFDDVEAYVEALATWTVDNKLAVKQEKEQKNKADEAQKTEKDEVYQELDDALDRGRAKYTDFNDVALNEKLVLAPNLVEIILDSEIAEEIMYYLGKNPEDSADISKLNPTRAAREITKIEAKLLAVAEKKEPVALDAKPKPSDVSVQTDEEKKVTPPKKTTEAPEPIEPVKTGTAFEKDPNSMSPKEYRAWRERNK